jgi:DNA-binding response OmpR family regulator
MKQIVIIDDDPGIQDAFRAIFKESEYNVKIYPGADKVFQADSIAPDLYIIDKQLSGIDGLEICRRLKSQEATKHIPVVMLSASPSIKELSRAAGADDAIEKPFSLRLMWETVIRLLK